VQYKQGKSYVKSHFCDRHVTIEVARFERTLGLTASSWPLGDDCRRGRC